MSKVEGKEEEKRRKVTLKVYRTNYNNKKDLHIMMNLKFLLTVGQRC